MIIDGIDEHMLGIPVYMIRFMIDGWGVVFLLA